MGRRVQLWTSSISWRILCVRLYFLPSPPPPPVRSFLFIIIIIIIHLLALPSSSLSVPTVLQSYSIVIFVLSLIALVTSFCLLSRYVTFRLTILGPWVPTYLLPQFDTGRVFTEQNRIELRRTYVGHFGVLGLVYIYMFYLVLYSCKGKGKKAKRQRKQIGQVLGITYKR